MDTETRTLTAQCYCKSTHFTMTVPTSSLPLQTHLCHCSVCRHVHGMLCCFHAPLPEGVHPSFIAPSTKDNLTAYETDASWRYFCSTCGCHVGDLNKVQDVWTVAVSIFEGNTEVRAREGDGAPRIWEMSRHLFDESTKDGGLSTWLPRVNKEQQEPIVGPDGEQRLLAQCHCGGVSFTISRPKPTTTTHPSLAALASPKDPKKYLASIDFCSDCRLVTGTHVVAWTFVPASATHPRVPDDLQIGTSRTYRSSDDVLRSFCGVCGATVFYSVDDRRYPEADDFVLDVAVGLLRAPEGARAEEWLAWRTGKGSYEASGEGYDGEFREALREGMRRWGEEKGW